MASYEQLQKNIQKISASSSFRNVVIMRNEVYKKIEYGDGLSLKEKASLKQSLSQTSSARESSLANSFISQISQFNNRQAFALANLTWMNWRIILNSIRNQVAGPGTQLSLIESQVLGVNSSFAQKVLFEAKKVRDNLLRIIDQKEREMKSREWEEKKQREAERAAERIRRKLEEERRKKEEEQRRRMLEAASQAQQKRGAGKSS